MLVSEHGSSTASLSHLNKGDPNADAQAAGQQKAEVK